MGERMDKSLVRDLVVKGIAFVVLVTIGTVVTALLFEGVHLNEIIWLWLAALIFLSGVAWWWFIEGRR